jgi:hypothetical protein
MLEKSLERVFRKAGGRVDRQPPTFKLLGEVLSKEDLMRLFPGKMTVEESKQNMELALELVDAQMMAPGIRKDLTVAEVRTRMPLQDDQSEGKGTIRFDLSLASMFPADTPRELWLDHAIVHETSTSYQDEVLTYLQTGGDVTRSPAFRKIESSKERRFRGVIPVANHLSKLKMLDFQPFFLFPVISCLGFTNHDAILMMKWMSSVFNQSLKLRPLSPDGIPLGVLKGRYKSQVRNALCFGILRGNALAMNSQGRSGVLRPS